MSTLEIKTDQNIRTITLNRPEVRNSFNDPMIQEMTAAFNEIGKDPSLRAVIIRGAGTSFCAGGDLNWMKSMVNYSQEENRQDSIKLFEMYQALSDIPVPVISVVHGHAMGGGLGIMAASDIVLAVEDTQFCFSEVRIGLAPAVISHFVAQKMRPGDMNRYFLTAEVFTPEQGQTMGLVHQYGAKEDIEINLVALTKKIKNNSPQAVKTTKALIKQISASSDNKTLTTDLIARLRVSEEGQEGLKAFFEKRKPNWIEG